MSASEWHPREEHAISYCCIFDTHNSSPLTTSLLPSTHQSNQARGLESRIGSQPLLIWSLLGRHCRSGDCTWAPRSLRYLETNAPIRIPDEIRRRAPIHWLLC